MSFFESMVVAFGMTGLILFLDPKTRTSRKRFWIYALPVCIAIAVIQSWVEFHR